MGYVLKDHMHTLMKLFDKDLQEYDMREETTRCLNTAVIMMFMYLGKTALQYTRTCDVSNVHARYQRLLRSTEGEGAVPEAYMHNVKQVSTMARMLLYPRVRTRSLYYIMLTNAKTETTTFPGHVFVIEKIPRVGDLPIYYMYQSYIHAYDLQGYMERNASSFSISHATMKNYMRGLEYLFNQETWDDACIEFWRNLTFTDAGYLKGFPIRDTILFCFQRVYVRQCANTLKQMLQDRMVRYADTQPELAEGAATVLRDLQAYEEGTMLPLKKQV
jgi:hypothetical protein